MGSFFPLFYGDRVTDMQRVYQLLSGQAQFWGDSWETRDSTARKPIWGNSEGQFTPPRPANDQALPLPGPPLQDLSYSGSWREANKDRLRLAAGFLAENDEVQGLLAANLQRADFNRYNLEILVTVARLCRQNLEMLADLAAIDESFAAAQEAAGSDAKAAVAAMDRALDLAEKIRKQRNAVLRDTTATWQKTWFPRGGQANGRRFLHELDDVKDHGPDRTEDMSYLMYRELLLPFNDWVQAVGTARNAYAKARQLPARTVQFDWRSLE